MSDNRTFTLDDSAIDRIENAIKGFSGNAEEVITSVLHEEAGPLLETEITRLMPVSHVKSWRGKKPHAKHSKSLFIDDKKDLEVTVKTQKRYQYLYFPDDGTNTRHHVGNQRFFQRGGINKQEEIMYLCVGRLVDDFNTQIK